MTNFWRGKKVLVTGGAGMVGSYLSEYIVADGGCLTVADNLERGSLGYLQSIRNNIRFLKSDLGHLDNCLKACKNQDIVINCAAKVTGIEYNQTHHKEMFEANMLLQQMPLRAAYECDVQRFVQISTACIYPHDAKIPTPESEGDRGSPEPTNEGYGWAKRMGEKLVEYYNRESDMECVGIRPFNGYGPRDNFDNTTSHVVPSLIKKILDKSDPVHIWGSGNQSRAFVHCRDFAKGIQLISEKAP